MLHAGYMGVRPPDTRHRVADAWMANRSAKGSHYATDGQTIRSYDWHITAVTVDGLKVAFDCHYSPTTTKQTGPAKVLANVVIPCVTCHLNNTRSLSGPSLEAVKAEAIRVMHEHPQATQHPVKS